ncbi:hypothetical protein LAWI1_G007597 [Lachnellula willkommii]|uniref:Uncharacterized protein n=1 Tax=Lachnellula willkommii TaxID=215461 RepID=A0A559M524_9HELO|nr:hypothetical protein LAWI1_G007597 [Lachnellula willkommii]
MQYQFLLGTFLALASSTIAIPSAQLSPVAQCWSTCSTSCVSNGNLRGGLCSDDATCTCLTGIKERSPDPAPQSAQCWESCSTDCVAAGNLRGGLCSIDGTCTCLAGIKAREAAPEPQAVACWESCSTNCEAGGNIQGGICSDAGFLNKVLSLIARKLPGAKADSGL